MKLLSTSVLMALGLALMLPSCAEESAGDSNGEARDRNEEASDRNNEAQPNFDQFRVISGPSGTDDYCVPDCDIPVDTCEITPYFGTMAIVEVLGTSDLIKLGGDEPFTVDHVCNPEDYDWPYSGQAQYREVQLRIVEHLVGDKFAPSDTKLMKISGIPHEDQPASGYRLLSFFEIDGEFFVSNWGYGVEPAQGMVSGTAAEDIDFPTDLATLRAEMSGIRQEAPRECSNGVRRPTPTQAEELARETWFGGILAGLCESARKQLDEPEPGE